MHHFQANHRTVKTEIMLRQPEKFTQQPVLHGIFPVYFFALFSLVSKKEYVSNTGLVQNRQGEDYVIYYSN